MKSLEVLISRTLRTGVLVSAITGLVGGTCYLAAHGRQEISFGRFHGTDAAFLSPRATIASILHPADSWSGSQSLAVMQLGIILLLSTPVVRVAFSLIGFAVEGDRAYVLITAIVLAALLLSVCVL